MDVQSINTFNNYESPEPAPTQTTDRPGPAINRKKAKAHTGIESFRKIHGRNLKVTGHPANFARVIMGVTGEEYHRSTSAIEVENGGIILMQSWYESGHIAQSSNYYPTLSIRKKTYTDENGNELVGYVLAEKEN